MPIYGYRCSQCGHELEVLQSMSDEPLRVCPECSGSLRKLLYPVGVQFKGSGFYTTDYKNGGGSAGKSGSNGSKDKESSSSKSAEGGGESSGGTSSSSEKKSATTAAPD
jgi:putative FmdB family regulatory protein